MDSSCSVCNEMCIMVEKCVLHNYSLLQVGPFNAQKLATCFIDLVQCMCVTEFVL